MIEDQPRFSELMVYMLEGIEVDVAPTLREAKALLDTKRYGLILVDLGLPDSEGLGTLRALQGYKTPKVVITVRTDLSTEATALGAIDYIIKVSDMHEIRDRVMFNISKVSRKRKPFESEVFDQLKTCLRAGVGQRELTMVG